LARFRIRQLYYDFNQPELVALQSPIDPATGTDLTPLSLWLREFAIEWGAFLDTPDSAEYLGSYKFGPSRFARHPWWLFRCQGSTPSSVRIC